MQVKLKQTFTFQLQMKQLIQDQLDSVRHISDYRKVIEMYMFKPGSDGFMLN